MKPEQYRKLREEMGLSQAQLGAAIGKDGQTVSNRERGIDRYPIDREAELAIRYLVEHPEEIE